MNCTYCWFLAVWFTNTIRFWSRTSLPSKHFWHFFCTAVEAYVPCSCHIRLPPECMGKNRPGRKPLHLSLCAVPQHAHFGSSKMVAEVEEHESWVSMLQRKHPYTEHALQFFIRCSAYRSRSILFWWMVMVMFSLHVSLNYWRHNITW